MRPFYAICCKLLNPTVLISGRCRSRLPDNGHLRHRAGVNIEKRSDRWVLERYVRAKARFNKNEQVLGDVQLTSNAAIVVLSTGAEGLGKSIVLELDNDRYLFNAPDGLTRAWYDANDGRPIPRTDNIFFTSKTLDTVGGLLGFMLNNTGNADMDLTIKLHGPPFVHSILRIMDYFSEKNEGRLSNIEWRGMPHERYEDGQLTVEYVALYDRSSETVIDKVDSRCIGQSESSEMYSDNPGSMRQTNVLSNVDSNLKNKEQNTSTWENIYKGSDSVSPSKKSTVANQKSGGLDWLDYNFIFTDTSELNNQLAKNRNEFKTNLKNNDSVVKRTDAVGTSKLNIDDIFHINESDEVSSDVVPNLKHPNNEQNSSTREKTYKGTDSVSPSQKNAVSSQNPGKQKVNNQLAKNRHEIKTGLIDYDSVVKRTEFDSLFETDPSTSVGDLRSDSHKPNAHIGNINKRTESVDFESLFETDPSSSVSDLRSNSQKPNAHIGNINKRPESVDFESLFETDPLSSVSDLRSDSQKPNAHIENINKRRESVDFESLYETDPSSSVSDLRSDSHKPNDHIENINKHPESFDFESLFETDPSSSVGENIGDSSVPVSEDDLENEEDYTEDYILQLQKAKKMAMAYIVKLKHCPQKVDAQRVYELGEKSGPWVGDLVRGKSVTLSDGRVVTPQEVYADSCVEVRPIVVLEVPSVGHLDDLLSSAKLGALQKCQGSEGPEVIVHMTPRSVMEHPKYKEFMDRYSCKHIILNEDSGMVNLRGAHTVSAVNNQVHPELFPLAHGFIDTDRPFVGSDESITYGQFCLKYVLRPEHRRGYDRSNVPQLDARSCVRSELETADSVVRKLEDWYQTRYTPLFAQGSFPQELKKFHDRLSRGKIDSPIFTADYPKITFLGTGTAKPNLRRNSSGIVLEMRKDEYMILDPGEGTYRQMLMMFGHAETLRILAHLKAVFVSHLHLDHHGGIFSLMKNRREAVQTSGGGDKVFFILPHKLQKWLKIFANQIMDISDDIISVPNLGHTTFKLWRHSNYEKCLKTLNLKKYMTVEVNHTKNSSGLVLEHNDGWKLVFSGDTSPHGGFIKYGRDCDILIHEATYLQCDQELARYHAHSTTAEAILVGQSMRAKFTLLTHFSGKMTHIPLLSEGFTRNVGYAFDMMQVRPNQLHLLYHMKPVFESIYGPSMSLANIKMTEKIVRGRKLAAFSQGMEETVGNHDDFRFLEYLKTSNRDSDNWKKSNLKQRLENLEEKQNGGG